MELNAGYELVNEVFAQLKKEFDFLEQWAIVYDSAKRRAGVCRAETKTIGISRFHVLNNQPEVVEDTVLHEIAHAIAFELHHDLSHGRRWKSIAAAIGATPRSSGRFRTPKSPWMLVTYCSGSKTIEKIAPRYRRNKRIRDYYLKGRPNTQGQLFYVSTEELTLFEENSIEFEELKFFQ